MKLEHRRDEWHFGSSNVALGNVSMHHDYDVASRIFDSWTVSCVEHSHKERPTRPFDDEPHRKVFIRRIVAGKERLSQVSGRLKSK